MNNIRIYQSHLFIKILAISLALACWIAALYPRSSDAVFSAAHSIPAFSSSSPVYSNTTISLTPVSDRTFEVSLSNDPSTDSDSDFDVLFNHLQVYDSTLRLVDSHHTNTYTDYYLYSSKLCINNDIKPLTDGFNIHIIITDTHHIYLGIPCIDYDL